MPTVSELKEELKKKRLSTKGTKAELEQRLEQAKQTEFLVNKKQKTTQESKDKVSKGTSDLSDDNNSVNSRYLLTLITSPDESEQTLAINIINETSFFYKPDTPMCYETLLLKEEYLDENLDKFRKTSRDRIYERSSLAQKAAFELNDFKAAFSSPCETVKILIESSFFGKVDEYYSKIIEHNLSTSSTLNEVSKLKHLTDFLNLDRKARSEAALSNSIPYFPHLDPPSFLRTFFRPAVTLDQLFARFVFLAKLWLVHPQHRPCRNFSKQAIKFVVPSLKQENPNQLSLLGSNVTEQEEGEVSLLTTSFDNFLLKALRKSQSLFQLKSSFSSIEHILS